MGFPFLTGFYSKDVILELTFAKYTFTSSFAYWLGLISAFFTSFYSFRLVYLTFWTKTNSYKKIISNAHDSSFFMAFPLFILSLGSIFIGYITKDMFLGVGTNFWNISIFNLSDNIIVLNGEFMPFHIKLLPLYFSFLGSFFVIFNNYLFKKYNYFKIALKFKNLYSFLIKKWYFDIIYNKFIIFSTLNLGFFTFKDIDRGIIEILGPLGIVRFINSLINKVNKIHTSYIFHYIFILVIGVFFFVTYLSCFEYIYIDEFDIRFYLIFILFIIFMSTIKKNNK